ncbi:6332_t:CDS:2, partial [Gigaspora rosea]
NQWNEIGSQDTFGPYGWIQTARNSTPYNSWANMSSPPASFNNMGASNRFGASKELENWGATSAMKGELLLEQIQTIRFGFQMRT